MITIDYNPRRRKAILSGDNFDVIREHFSVANPAARFSKKPFIPKRLYAITPTGMFDIGLVDEILQALENRGIADTVNLTDAAKKIYNPGFNWNIVTPLKFTLHDYQRDIVERCIKQGRGTVVLGTGGGKTLTLATIIENYYNNYNKDTFKCLIIVPDLGLVTQTYNEFKEYNTTFTTTMWTGDIEPDFTANVIIANAGILQSRFEQHEFLKFVDLLVVDEVHKLKKSNKLTEIVEDITTNHVYGLTGTLPEDNKDKWNLIGKIGKVLIEKPSHELRAEGKLTEVKVKILEVTYKEGYIGDYNDELDFIKNNQFRNKAIKHICTNFKKNILIVVNHIDHGEILTNLLKDLTNRQVFFIQGSVDVDERETVKQLMESSDDVICVAISSIFSTGINIKNIHLIMIAAGGKSFIRLVQTIGRGLRKHHSKSELIIIDIVDKLKYGVKHLEDRLRIYRKEKIEYSVKEIEET